jgi:hypothetical protein
MPFNWTESEAQAWSAIVQAVTAVLIFVLTGVLTLLTIYQHFRSARADRERLAEERIATAGLVAMDPPAVTQIVDDFFLDLSVANPTSQFALDVHGVITAIGVDSIEFPFGDIRPGSMSLRSVPANSLVRSADGEDVIWVDEEIHFAITTTWLRGQTVTQFFIWTPSEPTEDDEMGIGFIQDVPLADPRVPGVKPRKLI